MSLPKPLPEETRCPVSYTQSSHACARFLIWFPWEPSEGFSRCSGRCSRDVRTDRGAVFPALAALRIEDAHVRRAEAALAYGRFFTQDLVSAWRKTVRQEGQWQAHCHEGIRPVPCDLVGFYRPRLCGCTTKHYTSQAGKALPALVYGLCVEVGSLGRMRLGVPRHLLRQEKGETEAALQRRLVRTVGEGLAENEAIALDAGFPLSDVRVQKRVRFVVRMAVNTTARRNVLPEYAGKGTYPKWGKIVRPLPRKYGKNTLAATPPDAVAYWKEKGRTLEAHLYENLIPADEKPGGTSYRLIVVFDPLYNQPWVLATNLTVTAEAVWRLYRDRWPVEQLPLAAKQVLGAERSFVFGQEARYRLPELALLAGNILSYVAATVPAIPTGFWDRRSRPTCGRLRRYLETVNFSKLPLPKERQGQLRKKESTTVHLPKGILAHRRQKASVSASNLPSEA